VGIVEGVRGTQEKYRVKCSRATREEDATSPSKTFFF